MTILRLHVLAGHSCKVLQAYNRALRPHNRYLFQRACTLKSHSRPVTFSACTPSAAFSSQPHYSALGLDRAGHVRDNLEALGEAKAHVGAKLVPVLEGLSLITQQKQPSAVLLDLQKASGHIAREDLVFLGLQDGGIPFFGAPCRESISEIVQATGAEVTWVDLRREGPRLCDSDAALLALAQALVRWNHANAFSAATGEPMKAIRGGHARVAKGGGSRIVYPRIDPAAIMLVSSGDYVLLGRQSRWAPGRYSCLAGFIEIGETLEMAVAREVKEEAGVDVDPASIRYEASQPWPFPQSLMIGFQAHATQSSDSAKSKAQLAQLKRCPHQLSEKELQESILAELALPAPMVDTVELEDARWFHLSWLERQLRRTAASAPGSDSEEQPFSLPGSYALAHSLIASWMSQRHQHAEQPWREEVDAVEIDRSGTYKYVLLRLQGMDSTGSSRLLVRGSQQAGYHRDVVQMAQQACAGGEGQITCLGGGRIAFSAEEKCIKIYGYSSEYDQAPHSIAAALVRRRYPFHDVTVSYSGY